MQWLRHKKVTSTKDFKAASQQRWKHDENAEKSCMKMGDKERDGRVHNESNLMRKVHECKYNEEKISVNHHGAIGKFTNGALRTIDDAKIS